MTRWWLLADSKKLSMCGRAALRIWIVAALLGTPGTGGGAGEVARGAARAVSLSGVGGIASAVGALRLGVQALGATTVALLASSGSALSALAQTDVQQSTADWRSANTASDTLAIPCGWSFRPGWSAG
jgi:hypothetical protein